jgi:hypothetical protein
MYGIRRFAGCLLASLALAGCDNFNLALRPFIREHVPHRIQGYSGDDGSILPDKDRAVFGEPITLTAVPGPFSLELDGASLRINGAAEGVGFVDGAYRFEMPDTDAQISGAFAPLPSYPVHPFENAFGRLEGSPGQAQPGREITVTLMAAPGYELSTGTLKYYRPGEGERPIDETTLIFTMPGGEVFLQAAFKPRTAYTVTGYADGSGNRITPSRASAEAGDRITLTITPAAGYSFRPGTLKYRYAGNEYPVNETARTFTMPSGDAAVSAVFQSTRSGLNGLLVKKGSPAADFAAWPFTAPFAAGVFTYTASGAGNAEIAGAERTVVFIPALPAGAAIRYTWIKQNPEGLPDLGYVVAGPDYSGTFTLGPGTYALILTVEAEAGSAYTSLYSFTVRL